MAYQPRIPIRFDSNEVTPVELAFPLANYSFDIVQGMNVPEEPIAGVDGAWDSVGDGEAQLKPMMVTLSFTAVEDSPQDVDTTVDELLGKIRRFGVGKLWARGRDSGGADVDRWTWARAISKPGQRWSAGDVLRKSLGAVFRCSPYWFSETLQTESEDGNASPLDFTVNNPGTAPAYWMTIRVKADGAAGFSNVVITNQTNGYVLTGTRDASSADDIMRIDTELGAFEFSSNNGTSYSDDYASWEIGATQVAPFRLDVGDNSIRVTCAGTPDFTFELDFYPPWE